MSVAALCRRVVMLEAALGYSRAETAEACRRHGHPESIVIHDLVDVLAAELTEAIAAGRVTLPGDPRAVDTDPTPPHGITRPQRRTIRRPIQ